MELLQEVEHIQPCGNVVMLPVMFEARPRWENSGIGAWEYWGFYGFDKGNDYVSLEYYGTPKWDESRYTPEENASIRAFTRTKAFDALCNRFCEVYEQECLEAFNEPWP